jgi:hypothetical protein
MTWEVLSQTAGVRWSLESTAAGFGYARSAPVSADRGKPRREKANRRVSRVAGDAVVLTEAMDVTGTQRRSRNDSGLR